MTVDIASHEPVILPYGPRATLIETSDPVALADVVRHVAGVDEVIPAASTVLVLHDGRPTIEPTLADIVRRPVMPDSGRAPSSPTVVIDVVYDGVDLADVAEQAALSVDDVVALHTATDFEVAFCGFAPGFAYLSGLPERLHVPRRATPRVRVPAGSVAIAGPYAAIYPGESPGGWNLLGRTDAVVWDVTADPPALLTPGTRVRFRAVDVVSSARGAS